MTLKSQIIARIDQDGPISIASYMQECLLHPTLGYYTNHDPLGVDGDFITAPEITQMFGELIGLSLAQAWLDQGRPTPFSLAEPGPGRGTLMADLLRATASVPGFNDAAQIFLIEASPRLRDVQKTTLKNHSPIWLNDVNDLLDQPLFLVANEFFDALPVRQFVRSADGWQERRVGVSDGELVFGLTKTTQIEALANRLPDTKGGDLVEYCPSAAPFVDTISKRIATRGGAALILDYGDWRSLGDTFQAIRGHEKVNPLDAPGHADLTAHVDFEVLASAAKSAKCGHTRLTPQGVFLERLGITGRAQNLAKALSGAELDQLVSAHRRLTHPDEMGTLFKTLGIYPAQSDPPPGLEP